MLSLYEIWMCMRRYWWASFNIKLSIGHRPYAHIVYCYLFSLTRGRRSHSKKMHETHKHTQMATISRPATKPAEHDFFLGKMYMRTCNINDNNVYVRRGFNEP